MTVGSRELFADVFTAALRGEPCSVVGLYPVDDPVPLRGWDVVHAGDHELLDECLGATIDVGCGPGRMTAALGERGHRVLGVDIVPEAVLQTRRRGACALHRDVFEPLPAEGRWETALLADGNIGIGGDPVALLTRLRRVLAPLGRVVCDLAEPGTGMHRAEAYLECRGLRSPTFPWTLVGPEAVSTLAARTGFTVRRTASAHGRWFTVLERGDES